MRPLYVLAAAILSSVVLSAHPALAFKVDDTSGNNPNGTARYVDTDEVQPSSSFHFGLQGQTQNNSLDRTPSMQFTDPNSGGSYQGLQLPDSFYTRPSRRK